MAGENRLSGSEGERNKSTQARYHYCSLFLCTKKQRGEAEAEAEGVIIRRFLAFTDVVRKFHRQRQ